ncbi:MAG: dihydroxy-acid dehydratase, partial [Prolixibacteraceae bacterium]|nr:dihydroxy-acid dehydratase [Prolixibacteraceae bacterium]
DGDVIEIDTPGRRIQLMVSDEELDRRRAEEEGKGREAWKPRPRKRKVSLALRAYASMVTSADQGAVRRLES